MIMLADWHPDILEFIISKMQNPKVLRFIIETTEDAEIKQLAESKLKFTPLSGSEKTRLESFVDMWKRVSGLTGEMKKAYDEAVGLLEDGGHYSVHNPDFLTGANISVAITEEFIQAVENDEEYALRFPDVENYSDEEMAYYNENWHEEGDVREWERLGYGIKTYRTIKAKEVWNLLNICATYAAEPGIFFIDNANEQTNAQAYGQKVVATNPLVNVSGRI